MENKKKTLLNSVRNMAIAGAIAFGLSGDVDGQITSRQQTGQRVAVEAGQTVLTLKINDKIVIDGKEFRVVDLEGDAHILENTKTLELEEVDNSVIHKVLSEKKLNDAPKKANLAINDKIVIKGIEYQVVDRQKNMHILKNLKTGEYEKVNNSVISEVLAGKTNDAPKKESLGINDKIVIKGIEYQVVDHQKNTHILKNIKTGEYEKVNNSVISEVLAGKTNDAPKKESVNDEELKNEEVASTGHQVLVDRFGKGDPVILTLDINDEIVIGGQKYKVAQRKEDSHILKNTKTGALKEFDNGIIDDAMIEKRFGNPKKQNSGNNNGQRKPKSSRYQNKGRSR